MTAPERVPLADFLADLDDAAAAEARVAAARIDVLARSGAAIEGVERRFLPLGALAAAAFAAGMAFLAMPGTVAPPVTVLCLAGLPAVAAAYGLRVMARTRADAEAEALNVRHFLPHGGIYFAAGERPACVVRVPPQDGRPAAPGITRKDIWW